MRGGIASVDPFIKLSLVTDRKAPIEIDTGSKNFSARGDYELYNGSEYLTFNGTTAWPVKEVLNGTLELFTDPLQNNMQISIVNQDQVRNLFFSPKGVQKDNQFAVNSLEWSSSNFNRSLQNYDSNIPGINNLSRFFRHPWVSSLPYFSQGSPT